MSFPAVIDIAITADRKVVFKRLHEPMTAEYLPEVPGSYYLGILKRRWKDIFSKTT